MREYYPRPDPKRSQRTWVADIQKHLAFDVKLLSHCGRENNARQKTTAKYPESISLLSSQSIEKIAFGTKKTSRTTAILTPRASGKDFARLQKRNCGGGGSSVCEDLSLESGAQSRRPDPGKLDSEM